LSNNEVAVVLAFPALFNISPESRKREAALPELRTPTFTSRLPTQEKNFFATTQIDLDNDNDNTREIDNRQPTTTMMGACLLCATNPAQNNKIQNIKHVPSL
jgi:hypothetical protein